MIIVADANTALSGLPRCIAEPMIDRERKIPAPHYTLIETARGNDPAIVVVNSSLRRFDQRDLFPWHLSVSITCQLLGQNGMPTPKEDQALERLEKEISKFLLIKENSVFVARVTCRGQRELIFRAHDPDSANEQLQQLVSSSAPTREWEYRMEPDAHWDVAAFFR